MGESRLLSYMSNKEVRANLIAKLIELITPDTLNQVRKLYFLKNIFVYFKKVFKLINITLKGKCFLLEHITRFHDHCAARGNVSLLLVGFGAQAERHWRAIVGELSGLKKLFINFS